MSRLINHALECPPPPPPLYLSRENSCIRPLKFYYRNNSLLSVFYKNRYADNLSTVIEFVKLKFTISWSNERYCLPLYTAIKEMRFKSLGCERVVERINMFMYIGFESTLVAKTPRANRHFTCSHVWYSEIVREYSTRVTKVDNAGSEEFVKTVLWISCIICCIKKRPTYKTCK